jgi:two-component system cell cycle response regulator
MEEPTEILVVEGAGPSRSSLQLAWPLGNPLSVEYSPTASVDRHVDSAYAFQINPLEERHSCRVLVVDDDDLVCARLSALLKASQYQVEVAGTGEEALRILNSTHCHIVLTDWQMPDMDGLTLCRQVRLKDQESYIYVLMLTIRNTEHDMQMGLAAGADDYLVKGAPLDEILARLEIGRRVTQVTLPVRSSDRENLAFPHSDAVTGAHDLRYLVHHLPRELARAQRCGQALAILSCDIDGLEAINEQFGYEAGDELLRAFVALFNGGIRKRDWLARTGGREFMIVLPETTAKGAHCVAQHLRELFARHPLSAASAATGVRVNIGVTAVETQHRIDSTLQIQGLLSTAARGMDARGQFDLDEARTGSTDPISGSSTQSGGKRTLN